MMCISIHSLAQSNCYIFLHCLHTFIYMLFVLLNKTNLLYFSQGMNQRNGTDVDAANALKVFSKLGYKVKVFNDQTVDQMVKILTAGGFRYSMN